MVVVSLSFTIFSFTSLIKGTTIDSPGFSRPWINLIPLVFPSSMTPISLIFSDIAFSGQKREHPPHPWQSSGKTRTLSFTTAIALYVHTSAHLPQYVHFLKSTMGIGIPTLLVLLMRGFKNNAEFGSSTSQSRNIKFIPFSLTYNARLVATIVFPVPPLPLAKETTIIPEIIKFLKLFKI